jgi:hypothetical protein
MQQNREKASFMGLKPIESTQFTSALKHRPPEEKDFSAACLEVSLASGPKPNR